MTAAESGSAEHLTAQQVAAFIDRDLSATERGRIEAHLVSCDECRGEVIEVRREVQRRRTGKRTRVIGSATALAAAAMLLFVIYPRSPELEAPNMRTDFDAGRRAPIVTVAPDPGAVVAPGSVVFTWRRAGAESTYRIAVSSADGASLFSVELEDTTVVLPDTVELEAGRAYFWYVDAMLPDGSSAKSAVVSFTTARD